MTKPTLKLAALLFMVAGVLILVTAASIRRREAAGIQTEILPPAAEARAPAAGSDWLTEYTLTERSGREFSSQQLDGTVHVVNFFFAACPTVCRLQTGRVQELAGEFGEEGVVFLSITCDPTNDTPASLQNYAKLFDADPGHWLFLTSRDLTYLRRVGAEVYSLPVEKQVHSESLVVVDRWGTIRGRFHWNKPDEIVDMKRLLRELLTETEPPLEVEPHVEMEPPANAEKHGESPAGTETSAADGA